jgi:riboflavin kinase/FMN adenylyltransferase
VRELTDEAPSGEARGSIVSVGVFDGVHRGHQEVLRRVVAEAKEKNLASTVVTFNPHPARVLDPERAPRLIESYERRLARFTDLGLDQVRTIHFGTAESKELPEDFARRVLIGELRATRVIVGEDFRFGRGRSGSPRTLAEVGLDVKAVPDVGDGTRFSSTAARAAIEVGDLPSAEGVLGHRVLVAGEVIHGDGRGGAELGFPTANLALPADVVRPGVGIYAGAAVLDGVAHPAAISIGRRPQYYEHGHTLVEAHLLDFSGDLYGAYLDLVLVQYLRPELRFENVAALVAQMEADVAATRFHAPEVRTLGSELLRFLPGQ